jgi:hypothetical protein
MTTRKSTLPRTLLLRYRSDRQAALETNMQIYAYAFPIHHSSIQIYHIIWLTG